MRTTTTAKQIYAYDKREALDPIFSFLRPHQAYTLNIVKEFPMDDVKGLLLFHKVGSGKTLTALALAVQDYMMNNKRNKLIIASNVAIRSNWDKEIKKFEQYTSKPFPLEVIYLPLNSTTLVDKAGILRRAHKEPYIIIVDEAHNLLNGIAGESNRSIKLYDAIKSNADCRVYLLSGTPIVNDPIEITYCFNMLIKPYYSKKDKQFHDAIADMDKTTFRVAFSNPIFTLPRLARRLFGSISYYEESSLDSAEIPIDLGIQMINVEMNYDQRLELLKEKNDKFDKNKNDRNNRLLNGAENTYYRMNCNIAWKGNAANKSEKEIIDNCNKFNAIYRNICDNEGCALIYSQFTGDYGLGAFSKYLELRGWEKWTPEKEEGQGEGQEGQEGQEGGVVVVEPKNRFLVINGDVELSNRTVVQNYFNKKENADGSLARLLLVSVTGTEGLDFKSIRTVHMMEPYWNHVRTEQLVGRAIRFKSHEWLKDGQRDVKTFIYVATAGDHMTADRRVLNAANRKKVFVDSYLDMFKSVAIECQGEHCFAYKMDLYKPLQGLVYNSNMIIDMNFDLIKIVDPNKDNKETEDVSIVSLLR